MTKWYVDVVDDNGDVAIAYWLRLGWRAVALTFVSSLLFRGGKLVTQSRMVRAASPRFDGDTLSWRTGDIEIAMERRAPAVATSFLDDVVQWRCELPSAEAVVRVGDRTVRGRGYAEVMRIAKAPWRLPIEELHWGRFIGERSSAVWIEWRGPHPVTFVACDGRQAGMATVSDARISFDGRSLILDDRQVIREAPLGETLDEVPFLRTLVPRRLTATQETKWRSRGTLHGTETDQGWCIHEVVRFA